MFFFVQNDINHFQVEGDVYKNVHRYSREQERKIVKKNGNDNLLQNYRYINNLKT